MKKGILALLLSILLTSCDLFGTIDDDNDINNKKTYTVNVHYYDGSVKQYTKDRDFKPDPVCEKGKRIAGYQLAGGKIVSGRSRIHIILDNLDQSEDVNEVYAIYDDAITQYTNGEIFLHEDPQKINFYNTFNETYLNGKFGNDEDRLLIESLTCNPDANVYVGISFAGKGDGYDKNSPNRFYGYLDIDSDTIATFVELTLSSSSSYVTYKFGATIKALQLTNNDCNVNVKFTSRYANSTFWIKNIKCSFSITY